MSSQGTLHLDCITSDPSSSYLYGIASANKDAASKGYSDSSVVLVKSNYSPANLVNITWTVISSVNGKDFSYNYPTFTTVDCTVNDKGDFAAFFRPPYRALSKTTIVPMGLRYDPVADTWSPIRSTAHYGWTSERFIHKSFYSGDDLVHLLTGYQVAEISGSWYTDNLVRFNSVYERITTTAGNYGTEHEGQEPFVVGLTSDGLYEFIAFGPNAGSMAGPFKVNIPTNFTNLRQRIIASTKTGLLMAYQ
ncbi:hypothetical protein BGX33_007915, partial [Mortierella sp. NVP41]